MSVLDRFSDGMGHEEMVLGLLSTEASLNEEDAKRALSVLKRAYAHELAEKIRNAPFQEHLLQKHQRERAARLIDPEVLNSGGEAVRPS